MSHANKLFQFWEFIHGIFENAIIIEMSDNLSGWMCNSRLCIWSRLWNGHSPVVQCRSLSEDAHLSPEEYVPCTYHYTRLNMILAPLSPLE